MYKIELSEQDYRLVVGALGEQPAKVTMNVILNINNQVAQQLKGADNSEQKDIENKGGDK